MGRPCVTEYEQQREARLSENRKRMEALGLLDLSRSISSVSELHPTGSVPRKRQKRDHPAVPALLSLPPSNRPSRRSSRLQGATPPCYKEISVKATKEVVDSRIREPEIYTEEHEKLLGSCEQEWELFKDGFGPDGNRIYDSDLGKTCHQCRQKTLGLRTSCSKCESLRGQFCGDCLFMRYGENVLEALNNKEWVCPGCRGICNCSCCRLKKGWAPTGSLYRQALQMNYKSVAHYLIMTRRGSHPADVVGSRSHPKGEEKSETKMSAHAPMTQAEVLIEEDEAKIEMRGFDEGDLKRYEREVLLDEDEKQKIETPVLTDEGEEKIERLILVAGAVEKRLVDDCEMQKISKTSSAYVPVMQAEAFLEENKAKVESRGFDEGELKSNESKVFLDGNEEQKIGNPVLIGEGEEKIERVDLIDEEDREGLQDKCEKQTSETEMLPDEEENNIEMVVLIGENENMSVDDENGHEIKAKVIVDEDQHKVKSKELFGQGMKMETNVSQIDQHKVKSKELLGQGMKMETNVSQIDLRSIYKQVKMPNVEIGSIAMKFHETNKKIDGAIIQRKRKHEGIVEGCVKPTTRVTRSRAKISTCLVV